MENSMRLRMTNVLFQTTRYAVVCIALILLSSCGQDHIADYSLHKAQDAQNFSFSKVIALGNARTNAQNKLQEAATVEPPGESLPVEAVDADLLSKDASGTSETNETPGDQDSKIPAVPILHPIIEVGGGIYTLEGRPNIAAYLDPRAPEIKLDGFMNGVLSTLASLDLSRVPDQQAVAILHGYDPMGEAKLAEYFHRVVWSQQQAAGKQPLSCFAVSCNLENGDTGKGLLVGATFFGHAVEVTAFTSLVSYDPQDHEQFSTPHLILGINRSWPSQGLGFGNQRRFYDGPNAQLQDEIFGLSNRNGNLTGMVLRRLRANPDGTIETEYLVSHDQISRAMPYGLPLGLTGEVMVRPGVLAPGTILRFERSGEQSP